MATKSTPKTLTDFILQYQQHRPYFFSFIRPQEAHLFCTHQQYLKKPVLDFGCGDGFFAELVFGKKQIDIGIDVKDSRAAEAQRANVYKKVVFYDGITIPARDKSVGTVISNCVLEHLPDLDTNLREICRVLNPAVTF